MTPFRLRQLVRLLRAGKVISYPTEAVFGLGCNPYNETAIRRILKIKQRPPDKGLILIAADFYQLQPWILPLTEEQQKRVSSSWPGPVTWLLPARPWVPFLLRGVHTTLAVRVTGHPIAAMLCRAAGFPLVSTSANRSKRLPARSALQVHRNMSRDIDAIVAAAVGQSKRPSEIRTLEGRVVRSG